MMELRLHGAIWRSGDDRKQEWQRALDALNQHNSIVAPAFADEVDLSLEIVRLPSETFMMRLHRNVFDRLGDIQLDPDSMREHFADYTHTIKQMAHLHQDAPARGFESMDYAKRVVHDEAAAFIKNAAHPLFDMPEEDARRIFTLIFLIGGELPAELVLFHKFH